MAELYYSQDKKEISTLIDLMEKQYLSVGSHLQNLIKEKIEVKGEKFIEKPFMESQRKYCWEPWRVSNLIQNILMFDNCIAEMTVYRHDDRSQFRRVLDGQQRLTSIYMFLNDMIKLDMSKCIYPTFTIEGEQYTSDFMHGKLFSELPELWQDIIKGRSLRWSCVNNCDEETAEKLFVQLNSSTKILRPAEIRKAGMGKRVRKTINEAKTADWLLHVMTPLAVSGNQGDEVFSHIIALLNNNINPVSLASGDVNNIVYGYRESGLPEHIGNLLLQINYYLNETTRIWIEEQRTDDDCNKTSKIKTSYNTYRFDWFKKTNIVDIMIAAKIAIDHDIHEKDFANVMKGFFKNPSAEYGDACGSSGKKACDIKNVTERIRLITAAMAGLHSEHAEPACTEPVQPTEASETDNSDEDLYPDVSHLYSHEDLKDDFEDPFGEQIEVDSEELQEAV